MAYLITKSDGTTLTTVSDGQIDDLSTDLTFIGKNYSGFGESLNENFLKLLENFASTSRPTRPIRGQIWFDSSELKLKVYNGTAFQPVSSATISAIQPTTLTPGDLWFDDTNKQLYFYDGINTFLLGPTYGVSQGVSGTKVVTILDTLNQSKVITLFYNNGTLIGIFSSAETEFTPKIPIAGFSGTISPGFSAGTIAGIKFNVTATNSEKLGGRLDTTYVRNDISGIINGTLGVTEGVSIGSAAQVQLLEVNGDLILRNVAQNKFIRISANRGTVQQDAVVIEPSSQTVRIYDGFIASQTVVGGSLTVNGNLTVLGDTVAVDVSNLRVENKQIELGIKSDSTVLTNAEADNGGVILRAESDKEFLYRVSRSAWVSSENIDLAADKSFRIGGVELLKKVGDTYALTTAVTSATGIAIYGIQAEFTVDNIYLNNNSISIINGAGDLQLEPTAGHNIALVGSPNPRITDMGEPVGISDATTKNYVDTQLKAKSLVFTFDISDGITNDGIALWLEQLAPGPNAAAVLGVESEYDNGTVANILCTVTSNLTTDLNLNTSVNISEDTFNTPSGTGNALTDVTFSTVTIPAAATNVTRLIKKFTIISGAWEFTEL
jgi:hypothetical protein